MGVKEQGMDSTTIQGRWQVIPRTLCFVTNSDDILLMKHALHKKIFPNHYNGLGGQHVCRPYETLSGNGLSPKLNKQGCLKDNISMKASPKTLTALI